MLSFRRAVARILITPVLLLGLGFAQPHAHPGNHDHDGAEVVHQHFAPHHMHARQPQTTIGAANDEDADVVWLSNAVVLRTSIVWAAPAMIAAAAAVIAPPIAGWHAKAAEVTAPAHGPPRVTRSYRGPPLLLS